MDEFTADILLALFSRGENPRGAEANTDVLWRRYCLPKRETLDSIAGSRGVTRERIRQIEAKALRKLRHPTRAVSLRTMGGHVPERLWVQVFGDLRPWPGKGE